MFRLIFISALLICLDSARAQEFPERITVRTKILASDTNEPLAFATVYNRRTAQGTASNASGYFELPGNRRGDTLDIAYLGYRNSTLVLATTPPREIRLEPLAAELSEVVVTAQSDYLYDMMARLRRNRKTSDRTAKTYFFLETRIQDEPVEVIEAYYNGSYADHCLTELALKKGRIGLKPVGNRFFRSTESSRLFSRHDLFAGSDLFPVNPLALNRRELKRHFELSLRTVFREGGAAIFAIDFSPRSDHRAYFAGTVWVDRARNRLIKVELRREDAAEHPFVPIGFIDIQGVDMEISKTYGERADGVFVDAMEFRYRVVYVDQEGHRIEATTQAFTKAYDYDSSFLLPFFPFSKHYHADYRDITAVPYDRNFWNQHTEFRFYDRQQEIDTFVTKYRIDDRVLRPRSQRDSLRSRLQFPYQRWDTSRIEMQQASPERIEKAQARRPFASDRYHLGIELYLDLNRRGDSLTYQLCSILDPVTSYYYFFQTAHDRTFINMCFDLMEIQKRKLAAQLAQSPRLTVPQAMQAYREHLREFEAQRERLAKETDRGRDEVKTVEWNDYINRQLGIDNVSRFGLWAEH